MKIIENCIVKERGFIKTTEIKIVVSLQKKDILRLLLEDFIEFKGVKYEVPEEQLIGWLNGKQFGQHSFLVLTQEEEFEL